MHTTSVLAAAFVAAATLVSAEPARPKIYFPRNVKRQFLNATITSQQSSTSQSTPQVVPVSSTTKRQSLGDILSSIGDKLQPSAGSTTDSSSDTIVVVSRTVVVPPAAEPSTSKAADSSTSKPTEPSTSKTADPSTSKAPEPSTSKAAEPSTSKPATLSAPSKAGSSTGGLRDTIIPPTTSATPSSATVVASVAPTTATSDPVESSEAPADPTVSTSSTGILLAPTGEVTPTTSADPLGGITSILSSALSEVSTALVPNATEPVTVEPTTAQPTTILPTVTNEPTTVPTETNEPTTVLPTVTNEPTTVLPTVTNEPTTILPTVTNEPTNETTPIPTTAPGSTSVVDPTSTPLPSTGVETTPLPPTTTSIPPPPPVVNSTEPATTTTTPVPPTSIPTTALPPTDITSEPATSLPTNVPSGNNTVPVSPSTSIESSATSDALPTVGPTAPVPSSNGTVTLPPTSAPTSKGEPVTSTAAPTSTKAGSSTSAPWLPSTLVIGMPPPTKSGSSNAPSATATPIPSDLPKAITPDTGDSPLPEDTVEIQVGFNYALNYEFVASTPRAAAQIFKLLPQALGYLPGTEEANKVQMRRLQPLNTNKELGYLTTLAIATYPKSQVNRLRLDVKIPSSKLYQNPNALVHNLTLEINPAIDILVGSLDPSGNNGASDGSPGTPGGGTPNDVFNDNNSSGNPSASQRATFAGITVGAVSLAAAYGAAMFIIARRYKKKRQAHQRSSSLSGGSRSPTPGMAEANGSPALMGGALLSRDFTSSYGGVAGAAPGGRDSHGSGRSGAGNSGRTAFISAPVAQENSLGWN